MNVLIACEESQRVCVEFRRLGHRAFSCDIQDQTGGRPEWHVKGDVLPLINGNCKFQTQDGKTHKQDGKWDMIIAFPPCTELCITGQRWYKEGKKDYLLQRKAIAFFYRFVMADCKKIAIENPVGWMNTHWRKADQIIHPYYFGDNAKKRTCLWLKGLPLLVPTNMLPEPEPMYDCEGEKCKGNQIGWCEGMRNISGGQEERARARSKTFPGIAKAMAEQWGKGE